MASILLQMVLAGPQNAPSNPASAPVTSSSIAPDVLQKVDSFYTTSWNHLLVYTGIWIAALTIFVGLIGFVLPILLQRAQARLFKLEEESIVGKVEATFRSRFDKLEDGLLAKVAEREEQARKELAVVQAAMGELRAALTRTQEETSASLRKVIDNAVTQAKSHLFHLQGITALDVRRYGDAADSFATAIEMQAKSDDELNLQATLSMLIKQALPNVNKADFDRVLGLGEHLDGALKALEPLDKRGAYTERIAALGRDIRQAKERQPTPVKGK